MLCNHDDFRYVGQVSSLEKVTMNDWILRYTMAYPVFRQPAYHYD